MIKILLLCILSLVGQASAQWLSPVKDDAVEISSAVTAEELLSDIRYSSDSSTTTLEAESTESDARDLEDGADSTADIFISSGVLPLPPEPVKLGGNGNLTLRRQDTKEKLTVRYRKKDGTYDEAALKKIDHIMRCSLTGREVKMSVKLIELLDAVEDRFGRSGLTLLSGYRTLKYNGTLPGAARNSLHMLGWAADIKIPGYTSTTIKKYALRRGIGGVGYYPSLGFTHLDVGKPRYWAVKRHIRKRRLKRTKRHAAATKIIQQNRKAKTYTEAAPKRKTARSKNT